MITREFILSLPSQEQFAFTKDDDMSTEIVDILTESSDQVVARAALKHQNVSLSILKKQLRNTLRFFNWDVVLSNKKVSLNDIRVALLKTNANSIYEFGVRNPNIDHFFMAEAFIRLYISSGIDKNKNVISRITHWNVTDYVDAFFKKCFLKDQKTQNIVYLLSMMFEIL